MDAPARTSRLFSRLFLALWPDRASLRRLSAWQGRWQWPAGAAVVAPQRLHLTLHFIGAVPDARLAELQQGLAVPAEPIELQFGRVEYWPHGLVVLAPLQVPEALAKLHVRLREALLGLALPVQAKPFKPHLTLARKAAHAQPPAGAVDLPWVSRGYSLVRSQQGYHDLARYPSQRRQSRLSRPPPP